MSSPVLELFSSTTNALLYSTVALVVIACMSYLWSMSRYPGPWGVPVLGYYPFLKQDISKQLHELSKKYGEVYLINIAGQMFLHLGSARALRDAHVTKSQYFHSRFTYDCIAKQCFGNGLAFLNGDEWRVHRKFFSQTLREIGLGRSKEQSKGPITDSVESTIDTLRASKSEPVDMQDLLSRQCTSSILRLILGDTVTEGEAKRIGESFLKMITPLTDFTILLIGTVAKYFLLPWIRGRSLLLEGEKEMKSLLYKVVADHKKHFDPDQQPQNFLDFYLKERILRERKGNPQAKYFTDAVLVPTLVQAYGDGSISVGVYIAEFLNSLSKHVDVQDAIYEEIIRVVGTERLPTWEERTQFPLTNSAIKELIRTVKFFPIFPSLQCNEDTSVLGVPVPKGCITLVNAWAGHHDPRVYKNPEQFNATRFVPGEGKEEDPTGFGVGKRACAGEAHVMMQTFLFLTSLLQNFVFLPGPENKKAEEKTDFPIIEASQIRLRAVPRSSEQKT